MAARRNKKSLERWEVSLIKAMTAEKDRWPSDQDVLAYFTRPTRSLNHRTIGEIRTGAKHAAAKTASKEELETFLVTWPNVDPSTGLSLRGDELLVKAREAMIAAVHCFNSAGLTFRAELFIVTAIISWTYLMHAFFKREGIDYRYTYKKNGETYVSLTHGGADKFWELGHCLNNARCPIESGAKANLEYLIQLRHEIEHRSTSRIDDAVSAKMQACCINFNDAIKSLFGVQYGLERRLPIALQFVTFSPDQRAVLKKASNLPPHIELFMNKFESNLSAEEQADPRYAFRVFMVPRTANRAPSADMAVELVAPGSEDAEKINRVLLKEVEKRKYLPTEIVKAVQREGFNCFTMDSHTKMWKAMKAKEPSKGYGAIAIGNQWCWYETWLQRVLEECRKNSSKYRKAPSPPTVT